MKTNIGILVFRFGLGGLMFGHGVMKVLGGLGFMKALGGLPPLAPDNETARLLLGMVATAFELLGGLGVMLGYRVRWACLMIILVMLPAFAYHLPNITDFRSLMLNTWPLEIAVAFAAFAFIADDRAAPAPAPAHAPEPAASA